MIGLLASVSVLVYLLWWRWQVGITRFFDVDEFTHLHWAANMWRGETPYVDFFTFFTPGFYWFLQPLFWWFSGQSLFIAARVVAFAIFLGILGVLGYLFGKTRGWKWALLPPIILAFLPMPYDKFLEVRPDNLSTLIGLIGLICQIRGRMFWSGFFYALSLIVLAKMIPFVVVAGFVALLARKSIPFIAGLAVPSSLFFFWLVSLGDFSTVWYSLTTMPLEANMIGKFSIMEPHLFFFPNASFYGGWGITLGLIFNHAIWLIGLGMGVFRLVTPFVTGNGDKKRVLTEILIAGTFLFFVLGYVQFFPLKHSQYLIPIAVFIAYYAADALRRVPGIVLIVGVYFFIIVSSQVHSPKLSLTNAKQLTQVESLRSQIPQGTKVLDLEGRMIFWPDAYTICCLPFGSFTQFLSRKPKELPGVLEAGDVQYIFQGETGRLSLLSSSDLTYINDHYEPVEGWDQALWKRK